MKVWLLLSNNEQFSVVASPQKNKHGLVDGKEPRAAYPLLAMKAQEGQKVQKSIMRNRPPRVLLFLIIFASLDNTVIFNLWLTKPFYWQSSEETAGREKSRPNRVEIRHKPRIVVWSDHLEIPSTEQERTRTSGLQQKQHRTVAGWSGHGEPFHFDERMPEPLCNPGDVDCVIPGEWQETRNMTCNPIHEVDLNAFFVASQHKATAGKEATAVDRLRIVAKGGKRYVWRIFDFRGSAYALKMHRYRENRRDDFGPMTIELQRRDALLHEMTASSPYIVNMYGYCGASALFEFGDGGQLETNVKKYGAFVGHELLEIAHRVAESVADVQQSDHFGEPTVAHADIYGSQWVMVRGRYMLTDFNLAKLLKRSKQRNATVPFRREVIDNWFSPEVHNQTHIPSMAIVTAASDVWNLGNVLYLLLTGRPPFWGLSRQEVHGLLLHNQSRPEIPIEKRSSADPVDKAIVHAIDMCMNIDPKRRPTARYVANFLRDAWTHTFELGGRSTRFPSIETRVKFYMSNWYSPTCDGYDRNATNHYWFLSDQKLLIRDLQGADQNAGLRIAEIDPKIGDDMTFVDPGVIMNYNFPHSGYRADVVHSMLPLLEAPITDAPPILVQFGDRMSLHIASTLKEELFSVPYFRKCRPVLGYGEMERITRHQCYGRQERLRPVSPFRAKPIHEPIIWKLDSNRLLGPLQNLTRVDLPWHKKIDQGVFRGALTGHALQPSTKLRLQRHHVSTDRDYCNAIERCRLVLKAYNSSLLDARLTSLLGKPLNSTLDGVPLLGEKMEMQELLRYKVIVMLEGNDVSSGLRWALRSNSVVMMPPPTFTSWAMEELLQPWVHYIPLDPSFDNIESRMQWVLDHDAEAEQIARQGSLWIKDLLEHPDAASDNAAINKEIFRRYQKLFFRDDDLTTATA